MSKVISFLDRKKKEEEQKAEVENKDEVELSFEEIMERNKKNEERLKAERAAANRGVVRSHRLKDR